jgi:ABC-2 type transport system permease protein
MNIHVVRIGAIIQRHLLLQFREMHRIVNLLFWPIFDVVLWSYVSMWNQQMNPGILFLPVVGSFFWQACVRTSTDIGSSFSDEFLSKNLMNIFSSPVSFVEYIFGVTAVSVLRVCASMFLCGIAIWFITGFNVLSFGWWLPVISLSLFLSGLIVSLFLCAILLHWGMRAVEMIWMIIWCLAAFTGIFYPITILPHAFQMIGKTLPMTYTFIAVYDFYATGIMPYTMLLASFVLNAVYGIVAMWVLQKAFKAACERGLARLETD